MMYECNVCHKTFLHVAHKTTSRNDPFGYELIVESSVCPYCESLDIIEHVEFEPEISSVKSVDLADVDGYLKDGYVVHELYAKTATLVKKYAKVEGA